MCAHMPQRQMSVGMPGLFQWNPSELTTMSAISIHICLCAGECVIIEFYLVTSYGIVNEGQHWIR